MTKRNFHSKIRKVDKMKGKENDLSLSREKDIVNIIGLLYNSPIAGNLSLIRNTYQGKLFTNLNHVMEKKMRRIFGFKMLFPVLTLFILAAKPTFSGENLPKAVWTVNLVNSYALNIYGETTAFGGLTYDWRQNALWISHWGHNKMYQINKSNGNLILDISF